MNKDYIETVRLLLDVAPVVFKQGPFALKGGTAINLFLCNLPRLSVDLDLVYTNHNHDRNTALRIIGLAFQAAESELARSRIRCDLRGDQREETKLFVERDGVRVKVEVNHVFRGTLHEPNSLRLVPEAQDAFFTDLNIPVLVRDELYASKLIAAMDRQHPRDIFDVRVLWSQGGITSGMLDCLVAYLAGHNRPIHEVLFAKKKDLDSSFSNEFSGMTREPVRFDQLEEMQSELLAIVPRLLNTAHRRFLIGMASGSPDWGILPFNNLQDLPAIRWKLDNLKRLSKSDPAKFKMQSDELHNRLNATP